jgi:carboxypeptidase Q
MGTKRISPYVACAVVLLAALSGHGQAQPSTASPGWINAYRESAARLIKTATADDFAWQRLAELTDTYGNRLSGSENLTRAIAWAADTMKKDGFDNVHTEKVMVPKWTRGRESAEIVDPPRHPLAILGLGGTIATPPGGLEAEVVVVESFNELRTRAAEARGKIVLFNEMFTNYADTVSYRTGSARAAAQAGAVAVLVRSVGPMGLRTPHTGSVQYQSDLPAIPAASVSAEDANRIARLTARGRKVRVHLSLEGHSEGDAESANVVAELRGREKPEEIVVLGGHLDSWDVGAGASDDGVGCIITWEALRLMKKAGLQPRRTVRLVLWTNEENGTRGAAAYAERYSATATNHVFALEADSGVFEPARFGFSGSLAARNVIRDITSLLTPLNLADTISGGGGADIDPIAQAGRTPTMAYMGDPARYFTIHHSPADTVERIAPEEVAKGAAAIAVVTYIVAEMPERLPK